MEKPFVTSLSGASARQAIVEESHASAWLYMTAPNGEQPVADCFLYNTGEVWSGDRDAPPPLDPAYASDYHVKLPVSEDDIQIVWSVSGDAVAVRIHGQFVGFIGPHDLQGYSRSVKENCEWAHPFDVDLLRRLFAAV
jgi:hypothetical protein